MNMIEYTRMQNTILLRVYHIIVFTIESLIMCKSMYRVIVVNTARIFMQNILLSMHIFYADKN